MNRPTSICIPLSNLVHISCKKQNACPPDSNVSRSNNEHRSDQLLTNQMITGVPLVVFSAIATKCWCNIVSATYIATSSSIQAWSTVARLNQLRTILPFIIQWTSTIVGTIHMVYIYTLCIILARMVFCTCTYNINAMYRIHPFVFAWKSPIQLHESNSV